MLAQYLSVVPLTGQYNTLFSSRRNYPSPTRLPHGLRKSIVGHPGASCFRSTEPRPWAVGIQRQIHNARFKTTRPHAFREKMLLESRCVTGTHLLNGLNLANIYRQSPPQHVRIICLLNFGTQDSSEVGKLCLRLFHSPDKGFLAASYSYT